MSGASPQFLASEDIAPSVFVSMASDDHIKAAVVGEVAIGVMHESSWYAPIPGMDTTVAVIAGHTKRVYTEDEVCEVIAGVALAAGDFVTPDASGHAIVAVAAAPFSGIVLQGCASPLDRVKIVVTKGVAV